MNTATKIEVLDALFEAQNGLTLGWHLGNVKDDAKRAELQAPLRAGLDAVAAAIILIERQSLIDGDDHQVSSHAYGFDDTIEKSNLA